MLELPGYEAPAWLEADVGRGAATTRPRSAGAGSGRNVAVRVWSPAERAAGHAAAHAAGQRRPGVRRAVRAHPLRRRDDRAPRSCRRSGSRCCSPATATTGTAPRAAYSRVLDSDIVPQLRKTFGVIGPPAAMGASLGALAMLAAQRRFPRTFGALFLQSGSFFMPRYDAHERRFSRYVRITRFVRDTLRYGEYAIPRPGNDHRRARGGERAQQP